jgi:eukaryotic-like serine/threonine-protein kinase
MPEPPIDRIGSLIEGRYKITEVMASGAMGAVYKAERIPVGKLVAIKFLHASFASDPEFQARFERETRVMSKLSHPNCVSVLDFGAHDGSPYLVMDYVDGGTLRTRLDKGPLPPLHALAVARQVLAGLAHAHQQDVFHRDVKPANIMISEEIGHGERVRILDFGLARLQGNVGRDATQMNIVVGTPNYMAPEQTVPGSAIDARTDLYAVGVVLFEMIAGERPFVAEDTLQLLGMHRAAPIPRLAERAPGVELPIGLQDILDKAMAKSPGARYQTAIEFAEAIDEVTAGKLDPMEIDATLPKMKSGPVVVASQNTLELEPTVLKVDASDVRAERPRSSRSLLVGLLLLVGGASAMAAYVIAQRDDSDRTHIPSAAASDASLPPEPEPDTHPGVAAPSVGGDAAVAVVIEPTAAIGDAGSADDATPTIVGEPDVEPDIEIDPSVAEDPDDESREIPDDEDDDAPKTAEEIEKREAPPPAPQLARNVHGAVVMIKQGHKALALASLRKLWKDQPNSAYIPFLLGNLYFDKKWWRVSLDHYRAAIKKNAEYRKNAVLNRNVIRMLGSAKTRQIATNFIRGVIGSHAKPHLKWASQHEKNPVVRRQAQNLVRYIR